MKAQTPAKIRSLLKMVTSTGHAESPMTIVLQGKMKRTVLVGRRSVATPARRKSAVKVDCFCLVSGAAQPFMRATSKGSDLKLLESMAATATVTPLPTRYSFHFVRVLSGQSIFYYLTAVLHGQFCLPMWCLLSMINMIR